MSVLSRPAVAAFVARRLQSATAFALKRRSGQDDPLTRMPEFAARRDSLTIPVTPTAPAVVYRAETLPDRPGVHINFHGGGYIFGQMSADDALCRAISQHAGVVVIDVDYAVAPQYPFPVPAHQAYEVVRWVAEHADEHGWDADRMTIGGQSAGGSLAAAAARQALAAGGPRIRLQVLHYPPLDLTVPVRQKHSPRKKPLLRPWMGDVFDSAYVPDPAQRRDPLVSPASITDTADLTGIAPAVVIAAADDILHDEDVRYARRLGAHGALVELIDVPGADHGYDGADDDRTRNIYRRIAALIADA